MVAARAQARSGCRDPGRPSFSALTVRGVGKETRMTLLMSALAGGDHIDHADALRAGGRGRVLGFTVKAPSTLGTFRWGQLRQLDRVSQELLARGLGGRCGTGRGPPDHPPRLHHPRDVRAQEGRLAESRLTVTATPPTALGRNEARSSGAYVAAGVAVGAADPQPAISTPSVNTSSARRTRNYWVKCLGMPCRTSAACSESGSPSCQQGGALTRAMAGRRLRGPWTYPSRPSSSAWT